LTLSKAAVYGLAAFFPFENIQAIMSGTGMAGLFISLLRLLTKVVFDDSEKGIRISGDVFFAISACYMLACIGFYFLLRFIKHNLATHSDVLSRRLTYVKHILFDSTGKKMEQNSTQADVEISTTVPVKHEQLQKRDLNGTYFFVII
jgi:hypothetical protein